MNAPAANHTMDPHVAKPARSVAAGSPELNAKTRLSTDYLNHFTEAVMALEMVATMPEFLNDLLAWTPRSYREHFAASRFSDRHEIIAAYDAAPAALRDALDVVSDTLNDVMMEARSVVIRHLDSGAAEVLTQRALAWLKPLVGRLGAVIHGETSSGRRIATQATVDALFIR